MNKRVIAAILDHKLEAWLRSISDESIRKVARDNCIVTGGAIASLLLGEKPNDYDIYFKTTEAARIVAEYYMAQLCELDDKHRVIADEATGRVQCYIRSTGQLTDEAEISADADNTDDLESYFDAGDKPATVKADKTRYRPKHITSNAITLTDKVQLILRFTGPVEDLHKNFDFVHATCSYDHRNTLVVLPPAAVESLLAKELKYVGSRYPLASLIRIRKFMKRGWHINAGQIIKMALQLSEFDLKDPEVLIDQLTGVDVTYFAGLIKHLQTVEVVDNNYIINFIDDVFK